MTTPSARPLTVVVADENDVSRAGLRTLLADDGRFVVVGETADTVVPLAERLRPDLVVLDPGADDRLDLQLIAGLAAASPGSRICVRTSVFAPHLALQALEAGALAYVLKSDTPCPFLQDALALVGRFGAAVTGPAVVKRFRDQMDGHLTLAVPEPTALRLTDRERMVLALMVQGTPYQAIAQQFGIERSTVAVHVQHMLAKTGAQTRDQLCYIAGRQGLV